MPRRRLDPEEVRVKRQQRNQRYISNNTAKERKKEYDKLYQQRKREQERLRKHGDPLAQLADAATQGVYLEADNEMDSISTMMEPERVGEQEEDLIDLAGIVQEEGEILEDFGNDNGGIDEFDNESDNDDDWTYDDNKISLEIDENGGPTEKYLLTVEWRVKGEESHDSQAKSGAYQPELIDLTIEDSDTIIILTLTIERQIKEEGGSNNSFEFREMEFIDLTIEDEEEGQIMQSERERLELNLNDSEESYSETESNSLEDNSDMENDVDDDSLSPEERVAKMLVDHWINFNGCKSHKAIIGDEIMGMKEFMEQRQELLQSIPQFKDPDFAQMDRLPARARLLRDSDSDSNSDSDIESEIEDESKKLSRNPLTHMTKEEWKECYDVVGQIFTGGDDSGDEDGIKLDRYLEVGKEDVMFANSKRKREMARGEVTLDIDSILALFTDLSVINTVINISIISNPTKNLKRSVHIIHNGAPLHWIPHFYLGQFGHDPSFDLFLFLPALYDKSLKRRKYKLFNHVNEKVRAKFMDECLLPAIQSVLTPNEKQSWDFAYIVSQAKSQVIAMEKNHFKGQKESFIQPITYDLSEKHIAAVWNICSHRLQIAIRTNGILKAFRGFQFFINAKGYKHRTDSTGFSELMTVYKQKVHIKVA